MYLLLCTVLFTSRSHRFNYGVWFVNRHEKLHPWVKKLNPHSLSEECEMILRWDISLTSVAQIAVQSTENCIFPHKQYILLFLQEVRSLRVLPVD